jgi:branched-chain amino acid transport system ATP-binding protein
MAFIAAFNELLVSATMNAAPVQAEINADNAADLAIGTIVQEHKVLEAVLHTLASLLGDIEKRRGEPDFPLLAAAVFYIEDFHGVHHHPKEEQYLFSVMRLRAPDQAALLDELQAEHARDPAMIGKVQRALVRYQGGADDGFAHFKAITDVYGAAIAGHMRKEATLLERAQACLTSEDWREIALAFAANRDPLAGVEPHDAFRRLYMRIINRLPAKLRRASWHDAGPL